MSARIRLLFKQMSTRIRLLFKQMSASIRLLFKQMSARIRLLFKQMSARNGLSLQTDVRRIYWRKFPQFLLSISGIRRETGLLALTLIDNGSLNPDFCGYLLVYWIAGNSMKCEGCHLWIYVFKYLLILCASIYLALQLSINPDLSINQTIYPFSYPYSHHMSINASIQLSIYLFAYLSLCPSIHRLL